MPVGSQNSRAWVKELSGSPVILRFRAKAQAHVLQDHSPTLWRLPPLNPNSMLSDNGSTYISRISADIDNSPTTNRNKPYYFLAATKQLYKWYFPSVCLSVTPFSLCSHHRKILIFSGVITNDKSKVHAKGQGQRSKVKVTEVKTQLNRFRTVTSVWIHIWWWNDAHSLMLLRRGALLFFKVIPQISRSHG